MRVRLDRLGRAAIAGLLAAGLLLSGGVAPFASGPAPARAATPDLTLVTAATYTVQPAASKVAISVAITATNRLRDTATTFYSFPFAYLAVLPSTSGFKLKSATGSPSVSVSKRTATYTVLKLNFGTSLRAGASRNLTLTFDLNDPGGAPDRPIRISPSLVSFYAWAFATPSTPGSSVAIRFPTGYQVTIGRGPLSGPATGADGTLTWTSGALADPLAFVADVTADHPSDYLDVSRSVAIGGEDASLVVRSWPDDAPWRVRVGDLVVRALPVLSDEIGLPWPIQQPLVIQEALVRSTGGYAGLFDPAQDRIEIAYAAQPGVILHEASHAWFNGALVADRWAAEAFASYYAEIAATKLKITIASPELSDAPSAAAIPLNAWGAIGSASADTEAYAYAASLGLARAIAARAGRDGLQRVWGLAASHVGAYQPGSGPEETAPNAPDWRGLLDLLEDATGKPYVDLWRTWVVRAEDLPALDARAEARAAYAAAVQDAGGWLLPRSIRDAMRAWQFSIAEQQLTAAEAVLRQRTALERGAATASLQLPVTLRRDFESGDLNGAAAEAAAELAALGAIDDASAAQPRTTTLLDDIGLIGASPGDALRTSRTAFAAGDLDTATRAAAEAETAWSTAAVVGRGRVISAIGLLVALVLLGGLLLGAWRRRSAARANRLHSRP